MVSAGSFSRVTSYLIQLRMIKKNAVAIDKLGVCTSAFCMLHCLAVPLLVIFGLDSLLFAIDQEWIELTIIGASLVIGLVSFMGGFIQHRQHFVPVLFVAGFLLLVNGEAVAGSWQAAGLSIAGAAVIAYAHIQNLRLKNRVANNSI